MSMHRGLSVAGNFARRSLVVCAVTSLIASTALTPLSAAFAQAQQPANQQAWPGPPITAQSQAGDPPARAGRIAKITGTVSFHTADEDQWGPATLNYPLTTGNALWTEPGARAELQLGSANRLVMDGKSELNIAALDDTAFEANLAQGSAYVNLQDVAPGERYTIRTPRGSVQLGQPGRYAITAGDDDTPTTVSTLAGAPAQLAERGLTQSVPAGQTATLNGPLDGDDAVKVAVAPGQPSAFAQAAMAEERQAAAPQGASPPPAPNVAAAPVPAPAAVPAAVPAAMPVQVQGMTGAQDLAAYGSWSTAPQYGSVWYPPVQAGWVPYRHGHWAWVPPWGWTWVADEPWGFAPFHYGRWVMVHDRWAWSPGLHHRHHHHRPRPVYAPALVAFFGSSGGISVSVSIGRDVGWVPLGWHEPYYPPYRVSRSYIRNVNVTHVTNITKVTNVTVNTTTVNRYVNHNSATFVQADTMRHGRPVQPAVQRIDERQMQGMRAERRPQVQPERQPRQMQVAPGPRIDQAALRSRDPQRQDMQRNDGPRSGGQREMGRRQDQPQTMRQEQVRQQDQRPQQRPRDQQVRQQADPQRQVQREQQPERMQRQPQQERQRPDMQRQEQHHTQPPQVEQQRQMQREQQMRQQADQPRQMQDRQRQDHARQQQEQQRQQVQREQQAQQQRQHQEMQRLQAQQREQQMRQQADQQRQMQQQVEQRQRQPQVQQEQRRQQEAQSPRQQQEQRPQRRREADL